MATREKRMRERRRRDRRMRDRRMDRKMDRRMRGKKMGMLEVVGVDAKFRTNEWEIVVEIEVGIESIDLEVEKLGEKVMQTN